jgi:hypothetical protein
LYPLSEFKILETMLINKIEVHGKIRRINPWNTCYYSGRKLLASHPLSKPLKCCFLRAWNAMTCFGVSMKCVKKSETELLSLKYRLNDGRIGFPFPTVERTSFTSQQYLNLPWGPPSLLSDEN